MIFALFNAHASEPFIQADKIKYDETKGYIEASGNVIFIFENYNIFADKIIYNLNDDEVKGYGNIRALDGGKTLALGETIIFHTKAKNAIISHLILYFKSNNAILSARIAEKLDDNRSKLSNVVYTSCPACKNQKPLWQINAQKVHINKEDHRIIYKNAFFKIYGVPVLYLPYFSHHTPGAPPRSGLLTPNIKHKRLGVPIYFRAKSNLDFTLTPRLTKKSTLYEGEMRHLIPQGLYKIQGSITQNRDKINNSYVRRYNIHSDGKFKAEQFHYGFLFNKVSDRGYLKEYYYKDEPFLVSNLYLYKTSGENFISINNLALQGLNSKDNSSTDPYVIPELNLRYVMPLENFDNTHFMVENYTATYRTYVMGNVSRSLWNTSFYTSSDFMGNIFAAELYNRTDYYKVSLNAQNSFSAVRTIPELRFSWRYPLGSLIGDMPIIVEPVTLIAMGQDTPRTSKTAKFEHIDKSNYDFSDTNFYLYNRYNGYDFHEYSKRMTYGLNSMLNLNSNSSVKLFIGQFQKLSKLANQKSDIVGRTAINLMNHTEVYYRFKKNSDNFNSLFDEIGLWHQNDKISTNMSFISAKDILDLKTQKYIKQAFIEADYNINSNWQIGGDLRLDLTASKPKQLSESIRVTYKGECVSISSVIIKDYSNDNVRHIKKSRDYSVAINLKTLSM